MTELAVSLSLYSSTSFNEALQMPVSMAEQFFESKSFADWKKSRESELKIQSAVVDRLNSVVRAVGMVAKVFAGRR